jgi:hypothetical protein
MVKWAAERCCGTERKSYEFTFGGSSVGNSKRLSGRLFEKLWPRKSQKAMMPRLAGMEIHNGKSSMKHTNITPRPITAAKPADFSMTYLTYFRTALLENLATEIADDTEGFLSRLSVGSVAPLGFNQNLAHDLSRASDWNEVLRIDITCKEKGLWHRGSQR